MGMAVARGLAAYWGLDLAVAELARRVGRGLRSGLGVHGFAHGGFLVDGGKRAADGLAPLVARSEFPEAWRVVLVLPPHEPGVHGDRELAAFAHLETSASHTDALCRLALLGMLPALAEEQIDAFGEAVYEFNARAGEAFAPIQGGVYASPAVAERVAFLRGLGLRGVGQSSWGPAVFAVVADADRADHVATALRHRFAGPPGSILITRGCNRGARVENAA
jgi:beta-RFAP synthase